MEKNYITNEYKTYLVKKEDAYVCKMALETFGYEVEEKKKIGKTQLEGMRSRTDEKKEKMDPLEVQFFELIERGANIRVRGLQGVKAFTYIFGIIGVLAFGAAMSIYLAELMEKGMTAYILMGVLSLVGVLIMVVNPWMAKKMITKKQKKNEAILNDNYEKLGYLLDEAKKIQEEKKED